MGISGEIRASKLALEPDVPDRPDSYRLGVTMELVTDSLHIQVGLSLLQPLAWSHLLLYRLYCYYTAFCQALLMLQGAEGHLESSPLSDHRI